MKTFVQVLFLPILFSAEFINVNAQKVSTLAVGKNAEFGITEYSLYIISLDEDYYIAFQENQVPFTATFPGEFGELIRGKLKSLSINPPPRAENSDYVLTVQSQGLGFRGQDSGSFKLEKTDIGWKIPDSAIDFDFETGYPGWYLPTATGFEAVTEKGEVLSTITRRNDLPGLCSLPTIESGLARGIVGPSGGFGSRNHPIETFTIYEGTKYVKFDRDGSPIKISSPAPRFFGLPSLSFSDNPWMFTATDMWGTIGSIPNDPYSRMIPYLLYKLRLRSDGVSNYLFERISAVAPGLLESNEMNIQDLVDELNRILRGPPPSLYEASMTDGVSPFAENLSELGKQLLASKPRGQDLVRLNRVLLEDSYPDAMRRDPSWNYGRFDFELRIWANEVIEESTDLKEWTPMSPQPYYRYQKERVIGVNAFGAMKFYRIRPPPVGIWKQWNY